MTTGWEHQVLTPGKAVLVSLPDHWSSMQLYSEGDALYESMRRDIAGARSSIRLELYLFADDEAGEPFIEALCRKAREGLRVAVRVDGIGSLTRLSRWARDRMRRSGVRLMNAPRQFRGGLHLINRRDHRKLLVVDGRAAYLGGFNIHRECSRAAYGERCWRDLHVRFEGVLARDAAEAFDTYTCGQRDWQPDRSEPPLLVSNHSRGCRVRLYCALMAQLAGAGKRIWVTSPYFVPNRGILRQLEDAARRGVDVRVLVPAKGDVPVVRSATRAAGQRLAEAGVRVYEYQPRMQHAKALLVDEDWSTLGTANIDYRSLFINDELNLITRSRNMSRALTRWFEEGFADSRVLTREPSDAWHPMGDALQAVAWRLRRWL